MPRRNMKAIRQRLAAVNADGGSKNNRPRHERWSYLPFDQWAPGTSTVFQILVSLRLSAAIWSPISDCDEVYNYWEPLHFLLYGNGFQTWEYSPDYAIRSYGYIGLHYLPSRLFHAFLPHTKVTTFYFVRCLLSFVSACSDIVFYSSVCEKFGNGVGRLTLCFQIFGTGYFVSSAAFLPSSFSMIMTSFAYGFWMRSYDFAAVASVAISALVGWPFAALLGAPIALDMLISSSTPSKKSTGISRRIKFIVYSLIAGSTIVGLLLICDSTFYGKPTLAPFNIVRYNIFTTHGPDLYGVAPISYYIINLALNWNVASVLSLLTLPFTILVFWRYYGSGFVWTHGQQWTPVLCVQTAFGGWLLVFFYQSHKEERFLYPIYSLLCVSAALTLDSYERFVSTLYWNKNTIQRLRILLVDVPMVGCLILFAVLSISRSFGQYSYYHAPFDAYMNLNERLTTENGTDTRHFNVCVGKEWYRYPSSFFLPANARMQFIKSEFAGLLPKPYPTVDPNDWRSVFDATRSIPSEMNDMNKEEPSRYVDLSACDYLVDLVVPDEEASSIHEPNYSMDTDTWTIIKSERFLISHKSNALFRAFYVPIFSEKFCVFGDYNLLERKR